MRKLTRHPRLAGMVAAVVLGAGGILGAQGTAHADPLGDLDLDVSIEAERDDTSAGSDTRVRVRVERDSSATQRVRSTADDALERVRNTVVSDDSDDTIKVTVSGLADASVAADDTSISVSTEQTGDVTVDLADDGLPTVPQLPGSIADDLFADLLPAVPDVPEAPAAPELPAAPAVPGFPEIPAAPELPSTIVDDLIADVLPDVTAPELPTAPTLPTVPTAPALPGVPGLGDIGTLISDLIAGILPDVTQPGFGDATRITAGLIADVTVPMLPVAAGIAGGHDAAVNDIPVAGDVLASAGVCVTINAAACDDSSTVTLPALPAPGLGELSGLDDLMGGLVSELPGQGDGASIDTDVNGNVTAEAIPVSGRVLGSHETTANDLPVVGDVMASAGICLTISMTGCDGGTTAPAPELPLPDAGDLPSIDDLFGGLVPGDGATDVDAGIDGDITAEAVPVSGSVIGSGDAALDGLPVVGDAAASAGICLTINSDACAGDTTPAPAPGGGLSVTTDIDGTITAPEVPVAGSVIGFGDAVVEGLPVGDITGSGDICLAINTTTCAGGSGETPGGGGTPGGETPPGGGGTGGETPPPPTGGGGGTPDDGGTVPGGSGPGGPGAAEPGRDPLPGDASSIYNPYGPIVPVGGLLVPVGGPLVPATPGGAPRPGAPGNGVLPPSTGDAGLLGRGDATTTALLLLLNTLLIGLAGLRFARRRRV